jgi:hypothetical protein
MTNFFRETSDNRFSTVMTVMETRPRETIHDGGDGENMVSPFSRGEMVMVVCFTVYSRSSGNPAMSSISAASVSYCRMPDRKPEAVRGRAGGGMSPGPSGGPRDRSANHVGESPTNYPLFFDTEYELNV